MYVFAGYSVGERVVKRIILLTVILLLASGSALAQDEPGDKRTDDKGIEQVWVPAGCFLMGSSESEGEFALALDAPSWAARRLPSEQPQHEVCLTEGYWIDVYEVTNEAFQAFVDDGGYTTEDYWSSDGGEWLQDQDIERLPTDCENDDQPTHPRACVTWFEAEAYAAWRGGFLPTEAQWEYAARGPESLIYPWGNVWEPERANVVDSTETSEVGTYPEGASWVGAHDMAGNVMEWVQDWLSDDYTEAETTDPTGPERGRVKVEKGGWWGSNAFVARSAYRHFEDPPTYNDHHIGFRIVSIQEPQ